MISRLETDLKNAQLARLSVKVSVLRMLLSEIKYAQIAKGESLTDVEVISAIQKAAKKRQESIEAYSVANRQDLVDQESAELAVLQEYLPVPLSEEELTKLVSDTITELGATSIKDMGKVISQVAAKASGRADGARISLIAKQKLVV